MQQSDKDLQHDTDRASLVCPGGESVCTFLSEVDRLRDEMRVLSDLVRTDELTGLYNYRHFMHSMELEMERARRTGKPMSLIMMDLDNFKGFNDRWGHDFGNLALQHTARLVLGAVRKLDIACRFGGEEFAIILPDTALRSAILLAGRLREGIATAALTANNRVVNVTASFGVDVYMPSSPDDASQFLQRADAFLLKAKLEGRNRVCHAAPEDDSGVNLEEREALLKP